MPRIYDLPGSGALQDNAGTRTYDLPRGGAQHDTWVDSLATIDLAESTDTLAFVSTNAIAATGFVAESTDTLAIIGPVSTTFPQRVYDTPGWGALYETSGTRDYDLPGGGALKESATLSSTCDLQWTEANDTLSFLATTGQLPERYFDLPGYGAIHDGGLRAYDLPGSGVTLEHAAPLALAVQGSIVLIESTDTLTVVGYLTPLVDCDVDVFIAAVDALIESADTPAVAGADALTAALAAVESTDSTTAATTNAIAATLDVTESSDFLLVQENTSLVAFLNVIESSDTPGLNATSAIAATADLVESTDVTDLFGAQDFATTLGLIESDDVLDLQGDYSEGTLDLIEDGSDSFEAELELGDIIIQVESAQVLGGGGGYMLPPSRRSYRRDVSDAVRTARIAKAQAAAIKAAAIAQIKSPAPDFATKLQTKFAENDWDWTPVVTELVQELTQIMLEHKAVQPTATEQDKVDQNLVQQKRNKALMLLLNR